MIWRRSVEPLATACLLLLVRVLAARIRLWVIAAQSV